MIRPLLHALLHVAVPGLAARIGWPENWLRTWLLLVLANAVDFDHLLADPLFDPNRCSIGFHPLHGWLMQPLWIALALWPPTRIVGVGVVIHMGLDAIDCAFMH